MKEIIAELKAKMKKPGTHILEPIDSNSKIFWVRKGTTELFDIDMVTAFGVEQEITLSISQRTDRDRRTTKYYSATPSQPEYKILLEFFNYVKEQSLLYQGMCVGCEKLCVIGAKKLNPFDTLKILKQELSSGNGRTSSDTPQYYVPTLNGRKIKNTINKASIAMPILPTPDSDIALAQARIITYKCPFNTEQYTPSLNIRTCHGCSANCKLGVKQERVMDAHIPHMDDMTIFAAEYFRHENHEYKYVPTLNGREVCSNINGKKIGSYESTKNSRETALATISSLVEKYCPFYQKTK